MQLFNAQLISNNQQLIKTFYIFRKIKGVSKYTGRASDVRQAQIK
jgi:hypothetical protein